MTTKICIIGGGSLAHVCAGVLATRADVEVRVLTRRPELWSRTLTITDPDGHVFRGPIACVTNNPAEALCDCHMALLCLPGYAIESTLLTIRPYVSETIVGSIVSSTGFFFAAHRLLPATTPLFGFQRVPYIARTDHYGHSARLLGYKPRLAVAVEAPHISSHHSPLLPRGRGMGDNSPLLRRGWGRLPEHIRQLVEQLWQTPTTLLGSHYEASLTNSNPILHTGRLYTLWHNWDGTPFDHCTLFYRQWTDEASAKLIAMDAEFMQLLTHLPVTPGAIPPLLSYYDSHDAATLTRKIRSIPAFASIAAPMLQVDGGWIPDFRSRYFTEDFPYGLHHIVRLSEEHHIEAPNLKEVYSWGMDVLERNNKLN